MTTITIYQRHFLNENFVLDPTKDYVFSWCTIENTAFLGMDRRQGRSIVFENCTIRSTYNERTLYYNQMPVFERLDDDLKEEDQKPKSGFKDWLRNQSR